MIPDSEEYNVMLASEEIVPNKFKPKVLTVNEEEKTISYTYYNKYNLASTAKFGYCFIGKLIENYLREEEIIA